MEDLATLLEVLCMKESCIVIGGFETVFKLLFLNIV
jgi:hypothetical protein